MVEEKGPSGAGGRPEGPELAFFWSGRGLLEWLLSVFVTKVVFRARLIKDNLTVVNSGACPSRLVKLTFGNCF